MSVAPLTGTPGKRPTTAYGFFVKMCYEEHKKKYPSEHVQVTEISKKCSEKWKTMTDAEKRRFFELAQKDVERYQAELAMYGGGKRKRQKKDPNAPKRALSAFFFFSQQKRPAIQVGNPEWRVGQVAQELGRRWKDMTQEEKLIYEEMATNDRERYELEMKEYKAGRPVASAIARQQAELAKQQAQQTATLQHRMAAMAGLQAAAAAGTITTTTGTYGQQQIQAQAGAGTGQQQQQGGMFAGNGGGQSGMNQQQLNLAQQQDLLQQQLQQQQQQLQQGMSGLQQQLLQPQQQQQLLANNLAGSSGLTESQTQLLQAQAQAVALKAALQQQQQQQQQLQQQLNLAASNHVGPSGFSRAEMAGGVVASVSSINFMSGGGNDSPATSGGLVTGQSQQLQQQPPKQEMQQLRPDAMLVKQESTSSSGRAGNSVGGGGRLQGSLGIVQTLQDQQLQQSQQQQHQLLVQQQKMQQPQQRQQIQSSSMLTPTSFTSVSGETTRITTTGDSTTSSGGISGVLLGGAPNSFESRGDGLFSVQAQSSLSGSNEGNVTSMAGGGGGFGGLTNDAMTSLCPEDSSKEVLGPGVNANNERSGAIPPLAASQQPEPNNKLLDPDGGNDSPPVLAPSSLPLAAPDSFPPQPTPGDICTPLSSTSDFAPSSSTTTMVTGNNAENGPGFPPCSLAAAPIVGGNAAEQSEHPVSAPAIKDAGETAKSVGSANFPVSAAPIINSVVATDALIANSSSCAGASLGIVGGPPLVADKPDSSVLTSGGE